MINKKVIITKTNLKNKTGTIIATNLSFYHNNKFIVLLDEQLDNSDLAIILHKDCVEFI